MKIILYVATLVSVFTYLLWGYLPKGSFYIGNGIFILLLCVYLFLKDKNSTIKFVLLSLSLNNFLDEIFFDNTKLGISELMVGFSIVAFAIIKYNNGRKRPYASKRVD